MDGLLSPKAICDAVTSRGAIGEEDVKSLRRYVFQDGVVDWAEAEEIVRIHAACDDRDTAWDVFYVEALTDFLVFSAQPKKYVTREKADFIRHSILADHKVESATEMALLVNVIHWSASCPEDLVALAVEAVRDSVINPDEGAYLRGRRPNQICDIDVALIRQVIFAGASEGGYTVTQEEAELLWELHEATREADNSPEWEDLFVKGIANYLMFPRGAPAVPTAEEYASRQDWLEQRRGVGGFIAEMGMSLGSFGQNLKDADLFGTKAAREREAMHDARLAEALSREAIDDREARWLIDHLGDHRTLDDNECALIHYIVDNAPEIHPLFKDYVLKAAAEG